MPFKRFNRTLWITTRIHLQARLPPLGQTQQPSTKRQTQRPPNGVRGLNDRFWFHYTVRADIVVYIPGFYCFVKGAGDEFVAVIVGPVDAIDFGIVSGDTGNGERAFLDVLLGQRVWMMN